MNRKFIAGWVKSMKIGIVVPSMQVGGVEALVLGLGRLFKQKGHDVTFIATVEEGPWWNSTVENGTGAVCFRAADSFSPFFHARKIGSYLAKSSYDVLILNHVPFAQVSLNMLGREVIALPVIHNDHEYAYRVALLNSDAWNVAVVVGPGLLKTATKLLPSRPIVVICNGVEVPDEDRFLKREKFSGRIKLLYIGRFEHKQKGVFLLPEILKKCLDAGLDVSLTLASDGRDRSETLERCRKLGVLERVEYTGTVPPGANYELMLSHHVLLLPSFYEGFPLTLLEAQGCGCVPVCSRLPGITDRIVIDGETGFLVEPGNADGFALAVKSISSAPDIWKKMSLKGREKVRQEFSLNTTCSRYLELISRISKGEYPPPVRREEFFPLTGDFFTWRDFIPDSLRKLKQSFFKIFKK